eukprot:1654973-Ditylum_brightwellii.AAC.1
MPIAKLVASTEPKEEQLPKTTAVTNGEAKVSPILHKGEKEDSPFFAEDTQELMTATELNVEVAVTDDNDSKFQAASS